MTTRRDFFRVFAASPLVAVQELHSAATPSRKVTSLPNGGVLIEDEKFTTGIAVHGSDITMQNCAVTVSKPLEYGMSYHGDNATVIGCIVDRSA